MSDQGEDQTLAAGRGSLAQTGKASAVALAVLTKNAAATALLTGLCGNGMALQLGMASSHRLAGVDGRLAIGWVHRFGLR